MKTKIVLSSSSILAICSISNWFAIIDKLRLTFWENLFSFFSVSYCRLQLRKFRDAVYNFTCYTYTLFLLFFVFWDEEMLPLNAPDKKSLCSADLTNIGRDQKKILRLHVVINTTYPKMKSFSICCMIYNNHTLLLFYIYRNGKKSCICFIVDTHVIVFNQTLNEKSYSSNHDFLRY